MMDLKINISAVTVFLQGLLSFFSPCVLPLLPVYMAYLSGEKPEKGEDGRWYYNRKKVLINTLFFVLGISFTFLALGIGLNSAGSLLGQNRRLLSVAGGVIAILFGLINLGILPSPAFLNREKRLGGDRAGMVSSPIAALMMGFLFSFSWTPCIGPVLSSVLLMSASSASRTQGLLLILVYTLGFVLPFLAVGLFTTSLIGLFSRHKGVVQYTAKIGGALMILMGILMLTGGFDSLSARLAALPSPTSPGSVQNADSPAAEAVTEAQTYEQELLSESVTEAPRQEATSESVTEAAEQETASASAQTPALPDAPDFTLQDQYGNTHALSDYKGKVVFLNFWATWCPPCRGEMPDIQALYEKYEDSEDVQILGVAFPGHSGETDAAGITAFLKENGYTYPVAMDEDGSLLYQYGISAFPTTFMITREGKVYGYLPGAMNAETMQQIIDITLDYFP